MEAAGFDPRTSHNIILLHFPLANCPSHVSCLKGGKHCIYIFICLCWKGGSGRGLASTHGYMETYVYDRSIKLSAHVFVVIYCIKTILYVIWYNNMLNHARGI
jgi:hypothetical protein